MEFTQLTHEDDFEIISISQPPRSEKTSRTAYTEKSEGEDNYLSIISVDPSEIEEFILDSLGSRRDRITHFEYVTFMAFKREITQLRAWDLGCRKPIKWKASEGAWVS